MKELMTRYFEAFNKGDAAAILTKDPSILVRKNEKNASIEFKLFIL